MAKGDSSETQNLLDQQQGQSQGSINQNTAQTQGLYNQAAQNYGAGTGMNIPDYSSIMNSYSNFLGGNNSLGRSSSPQPSLAQPQIPGQTNSAPTSGIAPLNSTGTSPVVGAPAAQNPNFTPAAPTGDANKDAIISVLNKYGVAPGGSGSGLSDVDYWAGVIQSSGDPNYVTGRLESDLKGTGPDSPGAASQQGSGANGSNISAIGGFQNFAQNGGFSPQDIQNLRARAIAPTRAIYQNATDDMSRQKALTGGYMPNFAAAQANLGRQSNQAISDANVNADASIAQLVQQGKLYGLTGMANAQLGALSGMTNAYGQTPGLSSTFGNQALQANSQGQNNTALQNALASLLLQGKLGQSQIPGNFQQGAGNVATATQLAGLGANALGASPPSGGNNMTGNLTAMINELSGRGYNNINGGSGIGNTNGPGMGQNVDYSGINPNTGLWEPQGNSPASNPTLGIDPTMLNAFGQQANNYGQNNNGYDVAANAYGVIPLGGQAGTPPLTQQMDQWGFPYA